MDPRRVIIEGVAPAIEGGRFPIKRSVGETVEVEADIFTDGHDKLAAVLRHRTLGESSWQETPMLHLENDRWGASFPVVQLRDLEYSVTAWVDRFASWSDGLRKKVDAEQDVSSELIEGAALVRDAAARARRTDAAWLRRRAALIESGRGAVRVRAALDAELATVLARNPDRRGETVLDRTFRVDVDRERASFGAWYETFPRSCVSETEKHGTFGDCEARLPYIAAMGFDVLYLPPIHPIGRTQRKGPNNTPGAGPSDPGSPWGIGAAEGGHTAVHPDLGTLADFRRLVARGRDHGIEIALDIAFQCSPDHPWVKEHASWFRWRPDGTIQYAENPPKKYQDIYPLDFDSPDWRELWQALRDVFLFWAEQGVTIFRVDNPHTKALRFWEWCIREVRAKHPDAIFLSEAFTRPKVMRYLAKSGFSQSYTYFTWRNAKAELTEYFTELTQTEVREYLRPNLFANTPDILHEYLQTGGRAAFQVRAVLASMLGGNYGIYGPAFELCETRAIPGTEEYRDSEKYQVRHWEIDRPDSLRDFITRLNEIRRTHPAIRCVRSLRFLSVDNDQILCFAKSTPDLSDVIVVAVNLDPHHAQSGWVDLDPAALGVDPGLPYQMHDLLGEARYLWCGERNYVALDPRICPAHVFAVRRRVRSEHDFDYYS
jgi:starch synthase (maltosyl-transferring)